MGSALGVGTGRGVGRELKCTATIRDPSTLQPDRLPAVSGPQVQVQRHIVDQIVDAVSGLPTLDVPVPQMVDQPMALLMALDFLVPEQVTKVPKISTPSRCPRTVLSVPQTTEQLVEAPTIVSLIEVIRQNVEQTVGGVGVGGGLPGFLARQSYSFTAEQIIDNPVPRRGLGGGLHGLHPGQSSTAFGEADHRIPAATAEQIVDIPVLRGAPHDFRQDPLSAAGSSDLPDTANQWVFRTFPRGKKSAEVAGQVSAHLLWDVSSWTPAAYVQPSGSHEKEDELLAVPTQLGTPAQWAWELVGASSQARRRRKRKKRRKRRLPRTSSRPSLPFGRRLARDVRHHGRYGPEGQARRRLQQWLMQGWFCWYCTSRCVPSCCRQAPDARHHGRYGLERIFRAFRFRQCLVQGSFCWYFTPRAVAVLGQGDR